MPLHKRRAGGLDGDSWLRSKKVRTGLPEAFLLDPEASVSGLSQEDPDEGSAASVT